MTESSVPMGELLSWGVMATLVMTAIIHLSQGLGLSRLSLSFLVGTFFTARRTYANIIGFLVYALGGLIFAFLYVVLFLSLGWGNWWLGMLVGIAHGFFLLVVVLPLIPYVHPRMANEYDGPTHRQRLEPPGFIGLNYGYRTPLSLMTAQTAYGLVIGVCFQISGSG
ncbi:MAG: hypothetical protein ACNA7W_00695 [Pseudomonadales bacterium]